MLLETWKVYLLLGLCLGLVIFFLLAMICIQLFILILVNLVSEGGGSMIVAGKWAKFVVDLVSDLLLFFLFSERLGVREMTP